jgi:copper chaperone CopZ
MVKQTFSVPNISCNHCVNTIQNELREVGGVSFAQGDANNKQITVEYEEPATEEKIREKLQEINYPAE